MRNGQSPAAEAAFRDAVKLAPDLPEAHLDLGLVLGREGKTNEAVASIRQALALNPDLNAAHMYLGIFLYQANQPEDSEKELLAELAKNPDNAEALTWLGTVQLAAGHPERAVASFDRAVELSPNDLNLLEFRGRAHNLVARDSYARMAKIEPDSWHVHRVQAQLYSDEGKHTEAIAEYQLAIKQEQRNPDLYEELGDEYRSVSQLDAAADAYQKGLAIEPANPVAMYNLGSIQVERGDWAAGVSLLESMNKVHPHSAVAEYYLGRGLAGLGKDEAAIAWLQKSASGNGNIEVSKRSWYELSRIDRKLHKTSEAQTALSNYNRLREEQDKASNQQIQDWKKLTQQSQ